LNKHVLHIMQFSTLTISGFDFFPSRKTIAGHISTQIFSFSRRHLTSLIMILTMFPPRFAGYSLIIRPEAEWRFKQIVLQLAISTKRKARYVLRILCLASRRAVEWHVFPEYVPPVCFCYCLSLDKNFQHFFQ